jgi:cytidylate kinase
MPIVTISRGTFSGGRDLADCLAERLDLDCVSREVLREAAEEHGVAPDRIADALERPPSLIDRLGWDRQRYLAWLREALCRRAADGRLVYHGLGGHFLLAGVPGVARILVIADIAYRTRRAMEAQAIEEREALAYIRRVDRDRRRWTRFLYGREWRDAAHFDLTVNLERIALEEGCELVERLLGFPGFAVTPETRAALENARIAAAAEAALLGDRHTRLRKLRVAVADGVVTVRGLGRFRNDEASVRAVLAEVEGVREVRTEIAFADGLGEA